MGEIMLDLLLVICVILPFHDHAAIPWYTWVLAIMA
jgi:hypothetical protein